MTIRSIHIVGTLLLSLVLAFSCAKKQFLDYPDTLTEDFESAQSQADLLQDNGGNWSASQLTETDNTLYPSSDHYLGGSQALYCYAIASEKSASKSSLFNNQLTLEEGKTFHFSAWYYIESGYSLDYLFLADLEERVSIGASPGIRLALADSIGYLVQERGKIGEKTISQESDSAVPFPRDQWVHIEWEVQMERKAKGSVQVWQDGELLISKSGIRTMPRDRLYHIQGTKGIYSNVEVGITANTSDNALELWVDEIEVWVD